MPMPVEVATDADPGTFHPNQPIMTFLAKISPKPSMTPLTNGMSILIASDENSAFTRVRVDKAESKTASVAVVGAG